MPVLLWQQQGLLGLTRDVTGVVISIFVFWCVAWPRPFLKFDNRDPFFEFTCFSEVSRWWLSRGRFS